MSTKILLMGGLIDIPYNHQEFFRFLLLSLAFVQYRHFFVCYKLAKIEKQGKKSLVGLTPELYNACYCNTEKAD